MNETRRWWWAVLLAAASSAWGCPDDYDDPSTGKDAGAASDAGKQPSDAGAKHDAGKADAGKADAGAVTKDAGRADAGGTSPEDIVVGGFNISLVAPSTADPEGHTSVVGKVYDGPSPEQLVWEEALVESGCRLLKPRVPFCADPCGGSAVCVEDDTCQSYPTAHDVGTVTVKGVKTRDGLSEFSMTSIAKAYQPKASVQLPFPAFAEGDAIRIEAAGGDFTPFAIDAKGVAPLELNAGELRLERDQPLVLKWNAAGSAADSRIHMRLDISHHGGSKGKIECDVADNAALTLSAKMVTQLLGLGVAGFPTVIVARESRGTTKIAPGTVALAVDSTVEQAVIIPGLTSCTKDADCQSPQKCQSDLTCK